MLERAYSKIEITKAVDGDRDWIIEGIATTPRTDRHGDIVECSGCQYQLPVPLVVGHDDDKEIGSVDELDVSSDRIKIRGRIWKNSELDYVERAIKKLKAGGLRGLSIGFRSIERKASAVGRVFKKWELLHVSLVPVPANIEATHFNIKQYDQLQALAASGNHARASGSTSGASALANAPTAKGRKMNLSEKIQLKQTELNRFNGQLQTLTKAFADEEHEVDEQETAQLEELKERISKTSMQLKAYTDAEEVLAQGEQAALASRTKGDGTQQRERDQQQQQQAPQYQAPGYARNNGSNIVTRGYGHNPSGEDIYVKAAACAILAHASRQPIEVVRAERYATNRDLEQFVKAVANPALTSVPGWAAELVESTTADFLEQLRPNSVYSELRTMGTSLNFGPGRASIRIPARSATPTLSGGFVGEAAPIRVGRLAITTIPLPPHKMGVISHYSQEMARYSSPQIEGLIRSAMRDDTITTIDLVLLDNIAASVERPAGLLNGVTGIPSSGSDAAAILADLRAALEVLSAQNSLRRPVWIMNPARVFGLQSVQTPAGTFLWRDEVGRGKLAGYDLVVSNNVPAGVVILMDAADFATAGGDAPEFLVSETATLHEDDGLPFTQTGVTNASVKPIVAGPGPGTPAFPVRSLFQTATIAVRMLLDITWAMRRPGVVTAITGVAW